MFALVARLTHGDLIETDSPSIMDSSVYVSAQHSPLSGLAIVAHGNRAPASVLCSCVNYAKFVLYGSAYLGTKWGNASEIKPTHQSPQVGDLIIFKYHVGVVIDFSPEVVKFTEANFRRCQQGVRELPLTEATILGYK